MRTARGVLATALLLGALVGTAPASAADTPTDAIVELRLDGVVDPFMSNYLTDGIAGAADSGAEAVLITIDTPGGLGSSMREITQAILNATVPVIGYVSPSGARAASAGTFILLSTNIAAMAPGTNVGAAHPVGLSGAIESDKATNDAAASIVSIAEARGRNSIWAESAVRDSVSVSAERALRLGVIDLIAPDVATLLREVNGTTVEVASGKQVTLDTTGAPIVTEEMGWIASFLHTLLDPNLAFIFFWLGLALLVLELFVPGGVAGTIGALMLVASIVALGMLPVQLIGVVLLIASLVFFVLELKHPGIGLPAAAGVICLLLGGWFLFEDAARVSPLVIVPMAAVTTFFFLIVVRAAIRIRKMRSVSRDATIVGLEGTVLRDLDPSGVVHVAAEEWSAEATTGKPRRGDRVRVVRKDGLRLMVEPVEEPASQTSAPAEGREP